MTPETPPTPLFSAFSKLGGCTPAGVHLTADEAAAVTRYIARHGISGAFVAGSAVMAPKHERPGVRPVVVERAKELPGRE